MNRRIAFVAVITLVVGAASVAVRAAGLTWTNLVNVSSSGDVLQKTTGCDGCTDAGASSQEEISAGDGYVEFTIGETNTFWVAGLSHGDDDTSIADIDFAFRFNGGGWADVLENGLYQSGGDTPYAAGDVFRVAIVGGVVEYRRNGRLLLQHARTATYPLRLDASLANIGATIRNAQVAVTTPPPPSTGWLIEKAGSPALRPRYTRAQIEAFLPTDGATGPFKFPAPYNTEAVRLTNAADCDGGQDCLWYIGYSYWRSINNHVGQSQMYIFLSTDRARGGAGPSIRSYDKFTHEIRNLGPLFDPSTTYAFSSGEGWYFSGTRPSTLYTFLVGFPQLWRFDVVLKTFDPVPALDLDRCPRPGVCPTDAAYVNQPHSSDDDLVHSATVQDRDYARIGCVVYQQALDRFSYFSMAAGFSLDECHVDKSGRWLMILETTPAGNVNNRIVDLRRGVTTTIEDAQGALGHMDMGFGYAVGADNFNPMPNATILLNFPVASTTRPIGPVLHFNKRWDIVAANHIAHGNARAGLAAKYQYACGSYASRVPDMADEIVCFSLDPNRYDDGSIDVLVVAPVMTDLDAPGGGGDYEKAPKGNLDVSGEYFIWTTNLGGDRLDAFVVKLPVELAAIVPSNIPPPDVSAPVVFATLSTPANAAGWNNTPVSVTWTAADAESEIVSTEGCEPVSVAEATSGVTFTCSATNAVGLSASASVTVKVDLTPPVVAPRVTSRPNAAGWYHASVTVSWLVIDGASGIVSAEGCSPVTVAQDTVGLELTCTAANAAGLSTSKSVTIKLDKTPAGIQASLSAPANAAGWHNAPVTVTWTVSDPESGVASTQGCDATTVDAETAGVTITCRSKNGSGLSSARSVRVKLDRTPPIVGARQSPLADAGGWNRTDVTAIFSCSDALSRVEAPAQTKVVLTAEGRDQTAAGSCRDRAGNVASRTVTGINIDKTPPAAVCSVAPATLGPPNHQLVPIGVTVNIQDALSGPGAVLLSTVTSSEADAGLGDGDVPGDIQEMALATDDRAGLLRAERRLRGSGRTYALTYKVKDAAGNQTTCRATAVVPR